MIEQDVDYPLLSTTGYALEDTAVILRG